MALNIVRILFCKKIKSTLRHSSS